MLGQWRRCGLKRSSRAWVRASEVACGQRHVSVIGGPPSLWGTKSCVARTTMIWHCSYKDTFTVGMA
jgi:hypothetical protein